MERWLQTSKLATLNASRIRIAQPTASQRGELVTIRHTRPSCLLIVQVCFVALVDACSHALAQASLDRSAWLSRSVKGTKTMPYGPCAASHNRRKRAGRIHARVAWSATLLACLSCSSDRTVWFTDETGGNRGQSHAGAGGSAGAGDRGGEVGHAGSLQGGAHSNEGGTAHGDEGGTGDDNGGAGSSTSGTSGTAGASGSAEAAGTSGTTGTSGSAGTPAGGASGSAGTSGFAGTAGAGGTSEGGASQSAGSSGAPGPSAAGGASGAGGAQQGSFTLSDTSLLFVGQCATTAQPLTITNTSSIPLTWHGSPSLSTTVLTPNGSTLQPGQALAVSVLPQAMFGVPPPSTVRIDADVAPSQTVQLTVSLGGKPAPDLLPPDIDFGNVTVGASATAFVGIAGVGIGTQILALSDSISNNEFRLSGNAPNIQLGQGFGWIVTFQPLTTGAKERTLTFTDFSNSVCPPNTFKARGVGLAP